MHVLLQNAYIITHERSDKTNDRSIRRQNMSLILKSAQASLEQFALSTQDQNAKDLFTAAAQQTQQVVDQVTQRVQRLEQEEPQYKGF